MTRRPAAVVFSAALAAQAVRDAAAAIVDVVASTLPAEARILVTADHRLLERDAARRGLRESLDSLAGLAEGLLPGQEDAAATKSIVAAPAISAALSAIAGALPTVLPHLVSQRQLAAEELVADEWEALAAVAGALARDEDLAASVVIDATRLVPDAAGGDGAAPSGVAGARGRLAAATGGLATAIRAERARPEKERDAAWLAAADALAAAIRDVLVAVDAPPAGGGPSPYARAVADEAVDRAELDGVLVVRAAHVEVAQIVDTRPLWFADRVHTTGTAVIAYALLDPATSTVLAGGVATGHQERFGEIGARIDEEPRRGRGKQAAPAGPAPGYGAPTAAPDAPPAAPAYPPAAAPGYPVDGMPIAQPATGYPAPPSPAAPPPSAFAAPIAAPPPPTPAP